MKRNKEINRLLDNISIFNNRLQNCSTKKRTKNKSKNDINNKISISDFNNTIISNRKSKNREQININRSSSLINSRPYDNQLFQANKLNKKNSDVNLNEQKYCMSPVPNNISIKTSIINGKIKSINKNIKNLFYSPASPYTPSISTITISDSITSFSDSSNSTISRQIPSRQIPSSFNAFEIPPRKIKVNQNHSKKNKYLNQQSIFKEKIRSLLDNLLKEISKISKKLAAIDYNKGIQLNEANENYIKNMKELYKQREKKAIQLFEKYRYGLEYIKYKDRKKYVDITDIRAQELVHLNNHFKFLKERIRTEYQMSYDLIKAREENEIKKLLENKIIEKTRKKLLNILGNND